MGSVHTRDRISQGNVLPEITLGISSVWRSKRIRDGQKLIQRLLSFEGVSGLELEYRIEPETAHSIAREVKGGTIRVYSVHNYCPRPHVLPSDKAGGDAFLLSSPDPEQRRLSVLFTKRSMEFAADLGAQAVVLHLGRVEMKDPMDRIKHLFDQGNKQEDSYQAVIRRYWAEREKKKSVYFETVLKNLSELLPLAERLHLQLGVENRYYLREIPNFEETGTLLNEFQGGPIGYWHDMGHAAVHANLGIQQDGDWLEAYGQSLAGIHIHDTKGYDDHIAPGDGDTDFSRLAPFLSLPVPKILELRPEVSSASVKNGILFLKKLANRYPFVENNRL